MNHLKIIHSFYPKTLKVEKQCFKSLSLYITYIYIYLHQYDYAKLFVLACHLYMLVTYVCISHWQNSLYFCLSRLPFVTTLIFIICNVA